ncbi:MAG TPA: hypothetical protein VJ784_03710, partial [Pyrinomonadaceae bacterium]|nr:hypothetical protein [Pyrinomonadaceae bacterium]
MYQVGEWEYEVRPLLRNPVEHPELFANGAIINRRLEILTSLLESNNPSLTLARLLRALFLGAA